MINQLNVRVYAAAIKDRKVLVLHEEYAGDHLMKPVSYTHLDVYKRQHLTHSDWNIDRLISFE